MVNHRTVCLGGHAAGLLSRRSLSLLVLMSLGLGACSTPPVSDPVVPRQATMNGSKGKKSAQPAAQGKAADQQIKDLDELVRGAQSKLDSLTQISEANVMVLGDLGTAVASLEKSMGTMRGDRQTAVSDATKAQVSLATAVSELRKELGGHGNQLGGHGEQLGVLGKQLDELGTQTTKSLAELDGKLVALQPKPTPAAGPPLGEKIHKKLDAMKKAGTEHRETLLADVKAKIEALKGLRQTGYAALLESGLFWPLVGLVIVFLSACIITIVIVVRCVRRLERGVAGSRSPAAAIGSAPGPASPRSEPARGVMPVDTWI